MFCTWSGVFWAYLQALKVALYDFFDGQPAPLNSQLMEKVNHYNKTKNIATGETSQDAIEVMFVTD